MELGALPGNIEVQSSSNQMQQTTSGINYSRVTIIHYTPSIILSLYTTGELVESTSKVFQYFYAKLVKILPMDDAVFIAELFSANLLSCDAKYLVDSKPTRASKAKYFLDHMIEPSVTTGVGRSFGDLIKVMENSEYDGVKELAKQIRCKLRKQAVNSETGKLM